MVAKKKKHSRQGWASKAINLGGILLGLSRILEIVFTNLGSPQLIPVLIARGATFGLSEGSLNVGAGARFYGPVGAAVGYRMFTSYLLKKFPVRR